MTDKTECGCTDECLHKPGCVFERKESALVSDQGEPFDFPRELRCDSVMLAKSHPYTAETIEVLADEIASLRAQLTEWQDDYAALKARAKEVVAPFAMLADLDAKNMHGLESVYPMVAAGRLHDAKQFLSALTAEASHE